MRKIGPGVYGCAAAETVSVTLQPNGGIVSAGWALEAGGVQRKGTFAANVAEVIVVAVSPTLLAVTGVFLGSTTQYSVTLAGGNGGTDMDVLVASGQSPVDTNFYRFEIE
jgi:hypothetical protein